MSDNCAACCREYSRHLESERAARRDLEQRFETHQRESFIRRGTLTRANHALQDTIRKLHEAEATIEALTATLAEWHRLGTNSPSMPLHLAIQELSGMADPHDVSRLEDLPAVGSAA